MVIAHGALYGWWIVDDAAITWAYAESIADGAGPVLRPAGPAAEGWSNPSWLAVWIVLAWLGLPAVITAKVLAAVCCAAVSAAFLSLARSARVPRPELVAAAAGVLLATVPSFVVWAFSGLENPLYAALIVWLVAVTARGPAGSGRVAVLAGVLAAAAALTRPDGLVYLTVFPAAALAARDRRAFAAGATSRAVAAGLVGAYVSWRWERFGLLVPNTAIAKGQGAPTWQPVLDAVPSSWALLAGAAVAAGVGAARHRRARATLATVAMSLLLALGALVLQSQLISCNCSTSRPCTYCPTRSRGSLRANRGAIRRCSSVRPSAHAATSLTSTSSSTRQTRSTVPKKSKPTHRARTN